MTALMFAASSGAIASLRTLLHRGAQAFARDRKGRAAIHHAAAEGRADAVTVLLQLPGADVTLEWRDATGATPVVLAGARGHAACAELLAGAARSVARKTRAAREEVRRLRIPDAAGSASAGGGTNSGPAASAASISDEAISAMREKDPVRAAKMEADRAEARAAQAMDREERRQKMLRREFAKPVDAVVRGTSAHAAAACPWRLGSRHAAWASASLTLPLHFPVSLRAVAWGARCMRWRRGCGPPRFPRTRPQPCPSDPAARDAIRARHAGQMARGRGAQGAGRPSRRGQCRGRRCTGTTGAPLRRCCLRRWEGRPAPDIIPACAPSSPRDAATSGAGAVDGVSPWPPVSPLPAPAACKRPAPPWGGPGAQPVRRTPRRLRRQRHPVRPRAPAGGDGRTADGPAAARAGKGRAAAGRGRRRGPFLAVGLH